MNNICNVDIGRSILLIPSLMCSWRLVCRVIAAVEGLVSECILTIAVVQSAPQFLFCGLSFS